MLNSYDLSFEKICDRYMHCYGYLDYARSVLMRFNGVVAVGIGPKQSSFTLDPEQTCFVVFVEQKKQATELEASAFIPKELAGIKTDVVQIGTRMMAIHNELDARWHKQLANSAI